MGAECCSKLNWRLLFSTNFVPCQYLRCVTSCNNLLLVLLHLKHTENVFPYFYTSPLISYETCIILLISPHGYNPSVYKPTRNPLRSCIRPGLISGSCRYQDLFRWTRVAGIHTWVRSDRPCYEKSFHVHMGNYPAQLGEIPFRATLDLNEVFWPFPNLQNTVKCRKWGWGEFSPGACAA